MATAFAAAISLMPQFPLAEPGARLFDAPSRVDYGHVRLRASATADVRLLCPHMQPKAAIRCRAAQTSHGQISVFKTPIAVSREG
jgi:hypothetical protein